MRDGVTYYKLANSSSVYFSSGNIKVYHYPNNEKFHADFGDKYHDITSVETVPHIYTGSSESNIHNNTNRGANS